MQNRALSGLLLWPFVDTETRDALSQVLCVTVSVLNRFEANDLSLLEVFMKILSVNTPHCIKDIY